MWFEEEDAEVGDLSNKCLYFKMLELKTAILVVAISETNMPTFIVSH